MQTVIIEIDGTTIRTVVFGDGDSSAAARLVSLAMLGGASRASIDGRLVAGPLGELCAAGE